MAYQTMTAEQKRKAGVFKDHRQTLRRAWRQREKNDAGASARFETLRKERGMVVTYDKDKKKLLIEIDVEPKPKETGSGKSLMVASTRGFVRTDTKVNGKELRVNLNAIIPNE